MVRMMPLSRLIVKGSRPCPTFYRIRPPDYKDRAVYYCGQGYAKASLWPRLLSGEIKWLKPASLFIACYVRKSQPGGWRLGQITSSTNNWTQQSMNALAPRDEIFEFALQ